ncbi:MAG: polysaccharide lyase family protein [Planctomycetota bacterium]|nr:polysaccharide lyase family protein [Planctomycetota bacterium]
MIRGFALGLLWVSSAATAAEQIVWQIGKPDGDYAEFATAGNYRGYAAKFGAKPPVFEVGRSDPAKDWPFIQPGPVDSWAQNGGQPWTIRFTLPDEPCGVMQLRIEFVDVQQPATPRYAVTLGERTGYFALTPGGGDSSLTNPRAGKPQKLELTVPASFFKRGANEIRLACTEGSWVQYDAITLRNDANAKLPVPEIQSVTATATPCFIRRDGQIRRAVDVAVALSAPASEVALRVEAAGQSWEVPAKQLAAFGSIATEIGVPDAAEPLDVKITAVLGSQSKTAIVKVLPLRKWRIFVAPSSHTDVGYTDIQSVCAERHSQNADTALELMQKFPDFRWNLEVAWQAENYIQTRTGQKLEDFYRFAKAGKLGVQALYCNILTGLCSPEEACRLTWFAHQLHREQGIPYRSAMISDVPTQEASLPMILANAGIRYFSSGINNDRAYTFNQMQSKCPCWWEGPDGSRVLMMYMHGYAHASGWGLDTSVEAARARILGALAGYEKRVDYPYDAVFLHGAVSDNCPLNARLAEVTQQWNERYEFPKIVLCHNADFFEYIEKQYGAQLPVFRGSAGTYWEDGAGSSARETALCRNAHETLANGERFQVLADRIGRTKPSDPNAIYDVWRKILLYDEHTWGAHCSISQPESEFTKAQWKIKAQFGIDAAAGAKQVLDQGVGALVSLVRTTGPALVVFNPTSWPRTDVVQVSLPEGLGLAEPGAPSYQSPQHGTYVLVKDVPPCGYRILKLAPQTNSPRPGTPGRGAGGEGSQVLDSRFYRVEFDAANGGIVSIRDKEADRELVDAQAPYRLNQYVYVAGGNGTRIVSNPNGPEPKLTITASDKASLRRVQCPGLGQMMIVETSGTMAPKITSTILLWDEIKRIDIVNQLTKQLTYDKEGVYFAFPFAAQEPTVRYEVPAGIVNANTDMLPGACLDWFTVQHFVELESRDTAITWATPDAPLVCFQDVNRGKWQSQLPMTNGHVYAYVMNNYWHTNYLAGQDGDFTFRFAITSRPKADSVASARFGWAASNPLVAVPVVQPNPQGVLPDSAASLVSITEPNVIVIGTKQADDGQALVVRLWELTGQATTAHLKLDSHVPASKAGACNLVEEPQQALEVKDGALAVPIRGYGLATVRIE